MGSKTEVRGAAQEVRAHFGPSALATPANLLTLARLAAAPVYALLLALTGPDSWLLWVLWAALSLSDSADGHLARRHGATRSGAFLDPLADKFLVLGAMSALAAIGAFPVLAVVLIAGRELAMSLYRSYAGRRGVSVPARRSAKAKTWLQCLAIGFAVFPPFGAHHLAIARWTLWVAVAVTLFTGLQYALDGRRAFPAARAA
ncbi:MAG TPA: CDP-alcohol phosphatidyltransferase family protein [Acidimicrobiales bacterium]|nr:CDP-alcohol phosphatidyltransferase family protein [Acidimicrobiales bacterium]